MYQTNIFGHIICALHIVTLAIYFIKIMYTYHAGALAVFGGQYSRSVEMLNGTAWEVIGELEGYPDYMYISGTVQLPCPKK
jgi:hypothetical protein